MDSAKNECESFPVLAHVAPRTELPSLLQIVLQGSLICMITFVLIVMSIARNLAVKLHRSLGAFPVMEVGAICGLFLLIVIY